MPKHAVIVGAGLGGLATAIRLARSGYAVTVLERLGTVGGRANRFVAEGHAFDTGPTHLLMTLVLDQLFAEAGTPREAHLPLRRLDPCYRLHHADGSVFTMWSDREKLKAEAERFEPGAGEKLERYLDLGAQLHAVSMDAVLSRASLDWRAAMQPANAPLLPRLAQRLGPLAARHFHDARLKQAFTLPALYLGLEPERAPAIYAMLSHLEVDGGLYFPEGGMHAIPQALAKLARGLGVAIRLGCEVAHVTRTGDRATGVQLAAGGTVEADVVILNADLSLAYRELLGETPPMGDASRHSCGAFLLYLGARGTYPQLGHHTVIMPRDMAGYLRSVFQAREVPDDPLIYLANPNKTDHALAPAGGETLSALVPVPHLEPHLDWQAAKAQLTERVLDRLEAFGLEGLRDRLTVMRAMGPLEHREGLRLDYGAAFGLGHGLMQMGPFRPANRHRRTRNLYFVGASTHPGSGVPMVLLSAQLTAARIAQEHESGVAWRS